MGRVRVGHRHVSRLASPGRHSKRPLPEHVDKPGTKADRTIGGHMQLLDKAPVATLVTLAGIVVVVIAYISNDLNVQDALLSLGALAGGAGVLGHARNGAG